MPQLNLHEIENAIVFAEPTISKIASPAPNLHVGISLLHLHEIHPIVSGNKIFKLWYHLKECKISSHKKVITFGGAYSNHLAATAFVCNKLGLKCIGFIRGEQPKTISATLQFCMKQGMQLEYLSRSSYKKIKEKDFLFSLEKKYGSHTLIPEGGFSIKGARGAALITQYFKNKKFTHVCIPIGTATTFAGIISGSSKETTIIGFSVLKNMNDDLQQRLSVLQVNANDNYRIINDYHFGGYAKKTTELIDFLNTFYKKNQIPLDFVYTGKMMFGVNDLVAKNYFPEGSRILCIHTGGLQGNLSLKKGTLLF